MYKMDKQKVYTSSDVRNLSDSKGNYYFSPDTMRMFNSRLLEGFWPTNDDWTEGLVVVSNKQPDFHFWDEYGGTYRSKEYPRTYNVVLMVQRHKENGHTYVDFNRVAEFGSSSTAKSWAKKNAKAVGEAAKEDSWGDRQVALGQLN